MRVCRRLYLVSVFGGSLGDYLDNVLSAGAVDFSVCDDGVYPGFEDCEAAGGGFDDVSFKDGRGRTYDPPFVFRGEIVTSGACRVRIGSGTLCLY